jgi:hypothetical protein
MAGHRGKGEIDCRNRIGSDTTVRYNPDRSQIGRSDWQKQPPPIWLCHELIHADDAAYGRMNPDWRDGTFDYERQAIGLSPYEKKRFTENKLRSQWPGPNQCVRITDSERG